MTQVLTVGRLVTIARAELLRNGGVDNWEWYGDSIEDYTPSDDEYEDAVSFFNALSNGGVDNWDWYGESLEGLYEYEEYLDGLDNLEEAVDIYTWQEQQYATPATVQEEPAAEAIPAALALEIKGEAAQKLHQHIAENYPNEDTDAVYIAVEEAGLWKRNTFTKEFEAAIKTIKAGVTNPMEHARGEFLKLVIKNGKLDSFIKDTLNK